MHDVGSKVQRFEVLAHLGTGGMGTVLRARDPALDREVAIKLLSVGGANLPQLSEQLSEQQTIDLRGTSPPDQQEDLLREARMMARLSHPNVLPVFEVGLVDEAVFVVMEHIDGADLRAWRPGKRRRDVLAVLAQAARGLLAAHAQAIAHGDFKPDNVLVGSDGRARVADFGLAQLDRPAGAMRRLDRSAGTPRYMAPELAALGQPTPASDVYAFCVTAAEMLDADRDDIERTLPARRELRELIAAGLAVDPQQRPAIATIVAALERAGVQRRGTWLAAVAAIAVFAGSALVVATRGDRADSCTVGRSVGGFDVASSIALRAGLWPALASEADRERIARIVASFTTSQRELDDRWLAACRAERAGALTAQQLAVKQSCLTRRQLELATRIEHFVAAPKPLAVLENRAQLSDLAGCDEIVAPPLPADLAPVATLFRRLMDLEVMMTNDRVAATLELARDASAIGERELEVRALVAVAAWNTDLAELAQADEIAQRAYLAAVEIRSSRLQLKALTVRVRAATRRGNTQEAIELGKLTAALADRETLPAEARARAYAELGRAAFERSEPEVALATLDKGLAVIAHDGHRLPNVEASLRVERTRTLGRFETKREEALRASHETVDWLAATFGERSHQVAIGLEVLAANQQWNNDAPGALATYERAYTLKRELAVNDSSLWLTRADLARLYEANGRFEEARVIYKAELAEAKHDEMIRAFVPLLTVHLGICTCEIGRCDQGYRLIERGVEAGIAQYGADHHYVTEYRNDLLEVQIAIGKVDEAERTLAIVRRAWSVDPQRHAVALASLDDTAARIALARGSASDAEPLVRSALARAEQLGADAVLLSAMQGTLAEALSAQNRWPEAKAAIDKAFALARTATLPVGILAEHDIRLAVIEAGLGELPQAKQRARAARKQLTSLSRVSRKRADALLARR